MHFQLFRIQYHLDRIERTNTHHGSFIFYNGKRQASFHGERFRLCSRTYSFK
jgi:hypothetical protein